MNKKLEKQYNAEQYEDQIYEKWEQSGFFNPDNLKVKKNAPAYTIVLPPPNITDKLHLGHVAMLAIEGLLIRFKRMKGFRTLWLPGTDHAAIATQNVVEKKLLEKGITRHDLGREKFLKEVWKFLKETQETILNQTRKMGACLDWSRQAFTFDEPRQKAVKKMFVDMYKEGVIYRGERIVNWCPRCQSTLADDEVEHKAKKAKLYTFRYHKDFPFAIATTRPETKLGDTAVAVNPKDARYKKYVGKIFTIDFLGSSLKLKVVTDRNIDMALGTGALGVTPAHSMADWQIAEREKLLVIKVINEEGKIRDGFGKFSGEKALEAREMIVEELKKEGLLTREEEIENNLSVCYRCGEITEPLPSKQWFVAVDKKIKRLGNKSLKEKALEAAKTGEIKFIPARFEKIYMHWMDNLHDWCISRQIWFGHRMPVWYKRDGVYVNEEPPTEKGWQQDEDTLDTWFSSGMWTFSTLGWPNNYKNGKKSSDLARFHPTQVLETGYEIITLWVSRMIMMSFFALEEKPFSHVYLHGMILDKKGQKMSKSKGNGIDPLDVKNKFGADAVRLSLLIGSTPGNNSRLSEEKIAGFRNFVNKLWNISRYILQNVDEKDYDKKIKPKGLTSADKWILARLNSLTLKTTRDIEEYNFSLAGESLKEFSWEALADWYLEASKFEKNKGPILIYILRTLLKLWHPFIPFVTEAIWGKFNDSLLMVEKWPEVEIKVKEEGDFELIKGIITAVRNARSENKTAPDRKVKAVIYAGKDLKLVKENEALIKGLRTGLGELEIAKSGKKYKNEIYTAVGNIEIYLIGAIDKEKEKKRITKEITNLEKLTKTAKNKLDNKEFISKAPREVVLLEKKKLERTETELSKLKEQLKKL